MNAINKFDIAVLVTTICRPNLKRAIRSIFNQDFSGTVQILVGIDIDPHNNSADFYAELSQECPSNMAITWLDLGYSTSKRHGGVHDCFYGGSIRTSLSFLANAEVVVYLDDDDWLHQDHLYNILSVIQDKVWAFSPSIYADSDLSIGLYTDEIESVGIGKGVYNDRFGGFVRPSGLAINKMRALHLLHLWSMSAFSGGDGEDRLIFGNLKELPYGFSAEPTVYASIDPRDDVHQMRVDFLRSKGVTFDSTDKSDSSRA